MTLEFESFVRVRNAGEMNTWSLWGLLCGKISKMMTSSWDYTEDLFDVKRKKELNKIHKENGAEDFRTDLALNFKERKEVPADGKQRAASAEAELSKCEILTSGDISLSPGHSLPPPGSSPLIDKKEQNTWSLLGLQFGKISKTDLALNFKERKEVPADGKQRAASAEAELSECDILTSGDISLNPGHSLPPPLIEKKRKNSRQKPCNRWQKPQNRRQTLQCKKGDFKYVKFFLFAVYMTMHFDVAHAAPIFCGQGQKYDPLLRGCLNCNPGTFTDKHRHMDESCRPCDEASYLLHTEIEKNCTSTSNAILRCEAGYQQDPLPVSRDGLMCSKCVQHPRPCDSNQTTQMPREKIISILPGKEMNKTVSFTNSTTANKDVSRKINHREPPDDSSLAKYIVERSPSQH